LRSPWPLVAVALAAVAACLPSQALADHAGPLAGEWHLDSLDPTTRTTPDSSGHGLTGDTHPETEPTVVPGRFGNAFQFMEDENVTVADDPRLEPQRLTAMAWVKRSGFPGGGHYVIAKGVDSCNGASWAIYASSPSNTIQFYVYDGTNFHFSPGAANVWDGNWHAVAGVYDGSAVRLYVDGVQVGSGTPYTGPIAYGLPNTDDLGIGTYLRSCGGENIDGAVDEVRVYDKALNHAEIARIQDPNATSPVPYAPDNDADGVPDEDDNCPLAPNPGQQDFDGDGQGDACDGADGSPDHDGDGVPTARDNCPSVANTGQENSDGDGEGDACDTEVTAAVAQQPERPGGTAVLRAQIRGPYTRLEWDLGGDGSPEIVSKPGQDAVRYRPRGTREVGVTAIGIDGEAVRSSAVVEATRPQPSNPVERKVLGKLGATDPIYATGPLDDLLANAGRCEDVGTTIRAGSVDVRGCFTQVTSFDELPEAERGIARNFINFYGIPRGQAIKVGGEFLLQPMEIVFDFTDVYVAKGTVRVNGVDLRPSASASVVVSAPSNRIVSSNARMFVGELQLETPASLSLNIAERAGEIDLGSFDRVPGLPRIAGFDLSALGKVDVKLLPGSIENGGAQITVRLELPEFFKLGGGRAEAEASVRATADEGLVLDTLRIGPLDLSLGGLGIQGLRIDYTRALDEWKGQAKACVSDGLCLDMTEQFGGAEFPGGIVIRRDQLVRAGASLAFPGTGVPLFAGVDLTRIGFFVGLEPTRFGGAVELKVLRLLRVDGRLVLAFPSSATPWEFNRAEAGGAFPAHFYGRQHTNTTISVGAQAFLAVPVVGEVELGGAYFLFEYPGYVAFGGGVNADFVGVVQLLGRVDGEFNASNGRFSLTGQIRACVADVVCAGAIASVSSGGAGGCVTLGPVNIGGGVQWARVSRPFLWPIDGCKWTRFIEPNVRGRAVTAQAGSPHVVQLDPGEPHKAVQLDGSDGAPRVRVRGPSGQVVESSGGPGISEGDGVRIMRSESLEMTTVGLEAPGRWEIEPLESSPPVSGIAEAEEAPEPQATVRVSGDGARKTLRYRIRPRPDQQVTFFEATPAGKRELGTVSDTSGTLRFESAPGAEARTIEAQFELNGVQAERLTVARFAPPSPRLGTPARLKVRRRGASLRVSWKRVRGASGYEVVTTFAGRKQRFARTRRPRLRVGRIRPVDGGRVHVRAVDALRQGQPGSKPFRATRRTRTRAGKLPPPPRFTR
jgi:Concanavalin A-like lectin/glucanases superfamily/Thrombospondin type 3 repeat